MSLVTWDVPLVADIAKTVQIDLITLSLSLHVYAQRSICCLLFKMNKTQRKCSHTVIPEITRYNEIGDCYKSKTKYERKGTGKLQPWRNRVLHRLNRVLHRYRENLKSKSTNTTWGTSPHVYMFYVWLCSDILRLRFERNEQHNGHSSEGQKSVALRCFM